MTGLPSGSYDAVVAGSRRSEAIFGLRSLRRPAHPYVDTVWFSEALKWCGGPGDLLTTLCAAPAGVPEFLLDRLESPALWWDELCDLLNVDDETVRLDLRRAFRSRVPQPVELAFRDVRAGLAGVIGQLDQYVSTVLNPIWPPVSTALTTEAEQLRRTVTLSRGQALRPTKVLVTTAFGGRADTLHRGPLTLSSHPLAQAVPVLHRNGAQRAPLASLIGHTRTTILYALDGEMTLRDLARVTGQRRGNVLHHLRVLCRTNLVLAGGPPRRPTTYQRTPLADLLLDTGAGLRSVDAGRSSEASTGTRSG
ncbi:MAG TPA: winged helix-turn-helix domain-containing protein [Mycobacteriales bacterium]|nr:winged helix-turn-helix domain-containing protein [Mycobacteriales bacterium]